MMAYASSSTVLNANQTFTSPIIMPGNDDTLVGSVFADQTGTLFIEQSGDQVNWDISTSHAVTAGQGQGFSEPIYMPFVRIRYANGGTNQGAFRVFARSTSAGAR
jgi:hypothetical protein